MPSSPNYVRDYKQEYKTAKRRKEVAAGSNGANAKRKKARRALEKAGKVRKNDGKDVHHKNGNPRDNRRSNLSVTSRSKNRSNNKQSRRKK